MRLLFTGIISFGLMFGVPQVGNSVLSILNRMPSNIADGTYSFLVLKTIGALIIWTMFYNLIKLWKHF
jgi:hypothetical protein